MINISRSRKIYFTGKAEVWLPFLAALTLGIIVSRGGFVDYDESHVTLNTLKLMQQWTRPLEDPAVLLWPEKGTVGPTLYYLNALILALLSFVFGLPMDFSARMTSVLAFAVSCVLIKRIGSRIAGQAGGWFASALFLLCPLTRYIGHLVLGEALAVALLLGAIDALQRKQHITSGFLYGAAILTRITLLPVLPAVLWIILNDRQERFRNIMRFTLPVSLAMLPFLIIILIGRTGVFHAVTDRQLSGHSGLLNPEALRIWFSGLSPAGLALGLWGALRLARKNRQWAVFLVLWGILPALQLVTMGTTLSRYFYHVSIAWILAAAACIPGRDEQHLPLKWSAILLLSLLTLAAPQYLPQPERSPVANGESAYRQAAGFVLENSLPDDVIAAGNPALFYILLRRPVLVNVDAATIRERNGRILAEADHWGQRSVVIDRDVRYLVLREKDYNEFIKHEPGTASSFKSVYRGPQTGPPVVRVLANPLYAGKTGQASSGHIKVTGLNLAEALGLIRSKGLQIVNESKAVPADAGEDSPHYRRPMEH